MDSTDKLVPVNILDLLKKNVRITFNDGIYLKGDYSVRYIEVGTEHGSDGLHIMNEEGLKAALKHVETLSKELHSEEE